MTDFLVFTDLDGTLLDHNTYSFDEALPALSMLDEHACPVIFNSSKTASDNLTLHSFGPGYQELLDTLHELRSQHG